MHTKVEHFKYLIITVDILHSLHHKTMNAHGTACIKTRQSIVPTDNTHWAPDAYPLQQTYKFFLFKKKFF